jgi:hypothetical protein
MSRADRSAVSVPYETLTALPSKMSEASDSPQPARRAGEARADPGQGGGCQSHQGGRRRNRVRPSPEGLNDPETQGVSAVPQSPSTELGRSRNHGRHAGCDRSSQA